MTEDHDDDGSLIAFFGLTYAVSWAWLGIAVLLSRRGDVAPVRITLALLGTLTPALVALFLTARAQGSAGISALIGRMFASQVAGRWYVFAIVYMAAIKLAVALLHRLAFGAWPRFGAEPWFVLALAIVISTPVQSGEELGWRGYALPRLTKRMGIAPASLVLGVLWGVWHLPAFFLAGDDHFGQSLPMFVAGTTALSVAMAWLYANTNGSLLLAMLMHSAVNQTIGIVPSAAVRTGNPFALAGSRVGWLTDALLWTAAVYFLVRLWPRAPSVQAAPAPDLAVRA